MNSVDIWAMDPHPFGRNSSSIAPQKIAHKGVLGDNIWLLGTVARVRQKLPEEESGNAKGLSGGKSIAKGKSGNKSGKKG